MTLVAFVALMTVLFIALVVVPGVQRGGWLEIIGVALAIGAIAVFDRWFRRLSRRR